MVASLYRTAKPDTIEIESDMALIAVVGRGMKATRGTAGRIFSALSHANVNVKMIDQGSSLPICQHIAQIFQIFLQIS